MNNNLEDLRHEYDYLVDCLENEFRDYEYTTEQQNIIDMLDENTKKYNELLLTEVENYLMNNGYLCDLDLDNSRVLLLFQYLSGDELMNLNNEFNHVFNVNARWNFDEKQDQFQIKL
jgi:hypothetical protein